MTLRCKPLSECTADDITPMDARLRADAIDYLAHHGRDIRFTSEAACSIHHLLHLAGMVDGCGAMVNSDGVTTIPEGSFAGHFAPPPAIERIRQELASMQDRCRLQVRNGDLRCLSPGDEQRVAAELGANPHRHQEILDRVASGLRSSLGAYPARFA